MSKKYRPLNRSVTIACALFLIILSGIISVITSKIYEEKMYNRYETQMKSIINYVQSYIDNEDMYECSKTLVASEKHKETQEFFDHYVDYYTDLHYLYILKVEEKDGKHHIVTVCSANSTYEKMYRPDDVLSIGDSGDSWYTDDIIEKFIEVINGNKDDYFFEPSEFGTDYTLARPLISSDGTHYGALCVDVSIDAINETIYKSIYTSVILVMTIGVLFTVLMVLWLKSYITGPIKELEQSVTEFADSSRGKMDPEDLLYVAPEINANNEVGSLTDAITKMSMNMRGYVIDIIEKEKSDNGLNKLAYHDALTHVKNKMAYNKKEVELNISIAEHSAEFAIVMIDVNGLKKINDTYGHDRGNEYITGACNIICQVYDHSPVFRVGGDEFVVILEGEEYKKRDKLIKNINQRFKKAYEKEDLDPWNRYSAAVGMAVYKPDIDSTVKEVFEQADTDMYNNKVAMKAQRVD